MRQEFPTCCIRCSRRQDEEVVLEVSLRKGGWTFVSEPPFFFSSHISANPVAICPLLLRSPARLLLRHLHAAQRPSLRSHGVTHSLLGDLLPGDGEARIAPIWHVEVRAPIARLIAIAQPLHLVSQRRRALRLARRKALEGPGCGVPLARPRGNSPLRGPISVLEIYEPSNRACLLHCG